MKGRSRWFDAALVALLLGGGAAGTANAGDKRPLPDYDGRGGPPTTPGDVLLWVPRVILAPPYLVSEYVIRRPIGFAIAGAERAGWPAAVYEFLTFGPDHGAGVVPTALIDFGFRPSVGLYTFWNDAGARGNDLRFQFGTWGIHWLAASLADRVHLSSDPYDLVRFELSSVHRPDYAFFGMGPRSRQFDLSRYGSDKLEARILFDRRVKGLSAVHAGMTARDVQFHRGTYSHEDGVLADLVAAGAVPAPPGYLDGYTIVKSELGASLDSRNAKEGPSTGLRVDVNAAHSGPTRGGSRGWVTYGGGASAFLDLNHRQRVLSLSGSAEFVDPLGSDPVPFTEQAQLGGFGPMRGFYPGRLIDRSAVVAEVAYQWPIWIWLDGSMRFEMGNVFGEHLRDFDFGLLRMSGAIGVESVGSPDSSLELLFGVGTETIASGRASTRFGSSWGPTVAFEMTARRVVDRARALLPLGLAAISASCGHAGDRRFPLRDPLWQDTDRRPLSVPCEKRSTEKDPHHVACAPEPYVSPLIWDAADNSAFRPLAKLFAVDPPRDAINVNALDEVPDSAWFTNRLGLQRPSREALLRGACSPEEVLDGASAPPGSWVIDQGKANGASPGFRIRVGGKRKFMLKTDSREQPERPSAASAIGAAIYHAVGFHTSCEQVVFVSRDAFKLQPGLKVTDNTGVTKDFDDAALEKVFSQATPRDGALRLQASAWLPGYLLGPFRYEGRRSDDDNDAIPHEDRRDLRGARLLAAWLNHFDAREQNTMDSWIAEGGAPDSSPGYVRHYYLDTSDCFGSEWAWEGISRRLGRSYLLDWGNIAQDFVTLGVPVRSWERAERTQGMELFGYFDVQTFDPEEWKNEYPNPAFSRATERDNAWMARILSRFDRGDIEALVGLGKFSQPEQARYLASVLEGRLQRILERYLQKISPVADVRVADPSHVCATDLARRRAVWPGNAFHYTAEWQSEQKTRALSVEPKENGEICVEIPRGEAREGANEAAYTVITIANGVSRFPLRAHFYDDGLRGGYRLVGLERREEP